MISAAITPCLLRHDANGSVSGKRQTTKMVDFIRIGVAMVGALWRLQAQPGMSQEKHGVIPHAPLLKTILP
jgi:hypothetical protein